MAARLGHDCGRVVPTNVAVGAQRALAPTDNDDGSPASRRHKVSRLLQLIGARDKLPGLAEDVEPLELGDPGGDSPVSSWRICSLHIYARSVILFYLR